MIRRIAVIIVRTVMRTFLSRLIMGMVLGTVVGCVVSLIVCNVFTMSDAIQALVSLAIGGVGGFSGVVIAERTDKTYD